MGYRQQEDYCQRYDDHVEEKCDHDWFLLTCLSAGFHSLSILPSALR